MFNSRHVQCINDNACNALLLTVAKMLLMTNENTRKQYTQYVFIANCHASTPAESTEGTSVAEAPQMSNATGCQIRLEAAQCSH